MDKKMDKNSMKNTDKKMDKNNNRVEFADGIELSMDKKSNKQEQTRRSENR